MLDLLLEQEVSEPNVSEPNVSEPNVSEPNASEPVGTGLLTVIAEAGPFGDPLTDDDLQLALLVMYELHYRGIEGVDDRWEWNLELLRARAVLERCFERSLREATRVYWHPNGLPGATDDSAKLTIRRLPEAAEVVQALLEMTAPTMRPGLASYLSRRADENEYREMMIQRSVYHLKEADPHTWAIPRLSGNVKAALVEIQADEYGGGRPEWVHAELFARSMTALGLETRYGHYLDQVSAPTLASANAMSLFGLHRRLRGALVGHLAAFEMTSTLPNRLYAQGLRRLGHDAQAAGYFDEHVEADAVHEQIALRDLAGALVVHEPELAADVLFGAAAALVLDEVAADQMLTSWQSGHSSLRSTVAY